MKIGVPKEVHSGERRVATTPDVTEKLRKLGYSVAVEAGAGESANFSDEAYKEAGAEIVEDTESLWAASDIIFKVRAPEYHPVLGKHEAELLSEGTRLVSCRSKYWTTRGSSARVMPSSATLSPPMK